MAMIAFGFRTLKFCFAERPQKVHEQRQEVKVSLQKWRWKLFSCLFCESVVLDKNIKC